MFGFANRQKSGGNVYGVTMTKTNVRKRIDTAIQNQTKPNTGTEDRTAKAGPKRKCWHFSHWLARFEMDEYRRQGGLDYIRMFVTATTAGKSNESTEFFQQLAELKHYYPDQFYAYVGIFWTLGSLTATKEDWLRGYLIDADLEPLNESKLAARLQIDKKKTRQAMAALKRVGLIEYIDCPQFVHTQKDQKKKPAKKSIRKHSETFGNVSKSFKNKNSKRNSNENKRVNKQKATHGKAACVAKEKINDKSSNHKVNVHSKNQVAGQVQSKGRGKEKPPSTPTTTPPLEPQVVDELGGSRVIPFTAPQASFEPASRPQHPVVAAVSRGYDRSDEVFGTRVYVALGLRCDTGSPEGRREICCFASTWAKARERLARLPPEIVDGIGVRLIGEAGKIARRGKKNKRPGAVWCTVCDKLVRARLKEAI